MRILLVLFLLTQSLFLQAQDSVYVVETPIYKVHYSFTKQQPLSLQYVINCPNGTIPRSGDFWVDPKFATSDGADYENNVWDKGHLAPAASFSCTKEELRLTFSYLNCALQHESLNRGVWAQLEAFERDLAFFYEVKVLIELDFSGKCQVLPTGATVPRGFYKTIYWDDHVAAFYFPNQNTVGKKWQDFVILEED